MLSSKYLRPSQYGARPYICPRCRLRRQRTLSDNLTITPILSIAIQIPKPHNSSKRHSIRESHSLTNSASTQPIAEPFLKISNGESASLRKRERPVPSSLANTPLPKSNIRDRLKRWSLQNQAEKGLQSGNEVLTIGQSKVLPHSLFLDDVDLDNDADEFDEVDEWDNVVAGENRLQLERGDLMIIKTTLTRSQYAIFLGMLGSQSLFFLSDGRWLAGTIGRQVSLPLKAFATEEDLTPLVPFLPKKSLETEVVSDGQVAPNTFAGDIPSSAAHQLLLKMSVLAEEVLNFRRKNVGTLESMYDRLADENNHTTTTVNDIVECLFDQKLEEISDGAKMAVFQALHRDNIQMTVTNQNYRYIPVVITPKRMVRDFGKVLDWARQYQEAAAQAATGKHVDSGLKHNPLTTFIEKARRLILKSRQIRSPTTTGRLGPSFKQSIQDAVVATEETGEHFTDEDKCILEFLWHTFLREPPTSTKTKNWSVSSLILRAIGAYPKLRLDHKIGRLLLQELGCVAPWAEASDENVTLPIPGRNGAQAFDHLFQESEAFCDRFNINSTSATVPLPDMLSDVRRDLGDLEVLAIDNKTTQVVDDGVSLEPVPGQPDRYWIHIHIAHCSAFIDPDHVIAQRARKAGVSLYSARTTYHMLPWRFAMATRLAPGAAALTLSTLVTDDGEVKEIKMVPTRVNNVIALDHDAVDVVLGMPQREQASMAIGISENSSPSAEKTLEVEDIEKANQYRPTLQKLQELMEARVKARQREVPTSANFPFAMTQRKVRVSYLEPFDSMRLFRSYHYRGDPFINIVSDRYEKLGRHGEQEMISGFIPSLMIFACEIAGRWFKERQIPATFTGSLTQPGFPLSKLNASSPEDRVLQPVSTTDTVPIPHLLLNVAQYLRFTSPLRRYGDLMAHWQANAYLRAVADGVITDGDPAPTEVLPFTSSVVDKYIKKEIHMIKEMDNLITKSDVHWAYQALFRAFHFQEAELPAVWDCKVLSFISSTVKREGLAWGFEDTGVRVKLMPFALNAILVKSDERWEDTCHLNCYLPAKIEMVDLSQPTLFVRAVGPVSKTPTCLDPIKISSRRADGSQDRSQLE